VLSRIAIVILDPSAAVLTRIVVETSVVPVPMVVLEVPVAVAAAALPLEAAVRQIVDEESRFASPLFRW